MPSYYRSSFDEFIAEEPQAVVGQLHINYEKDGFAEQYLTQTRAWAELVPLLQAELQTVVKQVRGAGCWAILLELPLYRLQRRIDIIVLTTSIVVIEAKVGEDRFLSSDERQVEEYCLDLRGFHEGSRGKVLLPVLWATEAPTQVSRNALSTDLVATVSRVGATGLARLIVEPASGLIHNCTILGAISARGTVSISNKTGKGLVDPFPSPKFAR